MKVDFEKIGTISSYLASEVNELYVTKFLKLFYYLDFISYKIRGVSVTNDVYLKLPYGPVPTTIKNEIDLLSVENLLGSEFKSQLKQFIALKSDKDSYGKLIINVNKNYNLRKLSNFELELLKHLIKKFKNTRAKILSNQTHKEKPWLLTSNNAIISYKLANELDVRSILPSFNQ